MGYYTDTNPDTEFVMTSETTAENIPDLRRIRSINIMLIDCQLHQGRFRKN